MSLKPVDLIRIEQQFPFISILLIYRVSMKKAVKKDVIVKNRFTSYIFYIFFFQWIQITTVVKIHFHIIIFSATCVLRNSLFLSLSLF